MTITTSDRTTLVNNIARSAREVQRLMETIANRDGITRKGERKRIDHLNAFRIACVHRLQDVKMGA